SPALAQAVFDAMFSDMDLNLREMGVGDLSVGKRVRVMWEAFHGRCTAYQAAIEAGDVPALEAALVRNVWRGQASPDGAVGARAAAANPTGAVAMLPLSPVRRAGGDLRSLGPSRGGCGSDVRDHA